MCYIKVDVICLCIWRYQSFYSNFELFFCQFVFLVNEIYRNPHLEQLPQGSLLNVSSVSKRCCAQQEQVMKTKTFSHLCVVVFYVSLKSQMGNQVRVFDTRLRTQVWTYLLIDFGIFILFFFSLYYIPVHHTLYYLAVTRILLGKQVFSYSERFIKI